MEASRVVPMNISNNGARAYITSVKTSVYPTTTRTHPTVYQHPSEAPERRFYRRPRRNGRFVDATRRGTAVRYGRAVRRSLLRKRAVSQQLGFHEIAKPVKTN